MTEEEQIQDAIREYAAGYNKLQKLQEESKLIPEGDQKTGAIGEYYAMQYCRKKYKGKTLSFGGHSQASWDISIKESGKRPFKIQVKTVSAFAAGLKTTPIKILGFSMAPVKASVIDPVKIEKGEIKILEPWHQLFIIYLNKCFLPIGFWIFKPSAFTGKEFNKSFNLTLPRWDNKKFVNGSAIFGTKEANKGEKPRVYKYLVNENDEYWQEVLNEARDGKGLYACLDEDEVTEEKGD